MNKLKCIVLTQKEKNELVTHAIGQQPNESCAILLGEKIDGVWQEPINITKDLKIEHQAFPVSMSADGETLFLVQDDNDDGNIYVSHYIDKKWTPIKKLNKKIDCNIVAFPRDEKQKKLYKSLNVFVPETIDSISLLYYADAMIGAGGTMNREAAVLGIPTVSCYPEHILGVDKYLIKKGRMIHTKSINRIINYVIENIGKRNNGIELEDPTDLMFEKVCEYLKR